MARGKKSSTRERIDAAKRLMFGVPGKMSVEGARKMEELVACLYVFRAATLEQLRRCLPSETDERISYWLTRYPYIHKQMMSLKRYDAERREWIYPKKKGVYTLTAEALLRFEIANDYEEIGYTNGGDHKPKNVENTLHVIELFTRVHEISRNLSVEWVPNQFAAYDLKQAGYLKGGERLSTSGFIRVGDHMWGIGVYVNQIKAVVNTTKMMFQPQFYGQFDAIMLVRGEHLGRVHELAVKADRTKGVKAALYFRFVSYEFSLEHPKWFLGILQDNRWAVLDALIENVKFMGGKVESTTDHAFFYRITHPDGQVEYVDTSYGAKFMRMIDLLTGKAMERAKYTLYVTNESEIKSYKAIVNDEGIEFGDVPQWIEFRLIDWPGGK